MTTPFISFPPGTLGGDAIRLPVLANDSGYFALAKPSGVAAVRDSLHEIRVALLDAVRNEIMAGKRQFLEQGITGADAIHWPEPAISGVFLCAKTHESKAKLRNDMGALQFRFFYHFLAESSPDLPPELICELPIARHRREARMLISHKTGKKAFTRFRRLQEYGSHALWESESPYDRPHQVRLHAVESGLLIAGETLYAPAGKVSSVLRGECVHGPICLHHRKTSFPFGSGESKEIEMPYPKALQALFSRMKREGKD